MRRSFRVDSRQRDAGWPGGGFSEISDSVDGIKIDVFAPSDRIDHAQYALDAEKQLLASSIFLKGSC